MTKLREAILQSVEPAKIRVLSISNKECIGNIRVWGNSYKSVFQTWSWKPAKIQTTEILFSGCGVWQTLPVGEHMREAVD